jgi:hypothetical protein
MPIQRLAGPTMAVPLVDSELVVYELELSAVPSPAWRAAFLRPPAELQTDRFTPATGRVGVHGARVVFRTELDSLSLWLHRRDRWIDYANRVGRSDDRNAKWARSR